MLSCRDRAKARHRIDGEAFSHKLAAGALATLSLGLAAARHERTRRFRIGTSAIDVMVKLALWVKVRALLFGTLADLPKLTEVLGVRCLNCSAQLRADGVLRLKRRLGI